MKGLIFLLAYLFFMVTVAVAARAETLPLPEDALKEISAEGISTGGDLSTSCVTSSNAICVGTYEWNDNHQFDASNNKGAMVMEGNVQQNVAAESVVNATQSATATGVNVIGDIQLSNSTINVTNNNNSTSFIGGF